MIVACCALLCRMSKCVSIPCWRLIGSARDVLLESSNATGAIIAALSKRAQEGFVLFILGGHRHFYPVPDRSGDRVLFSIDFFVYIFVSFFVSSLARLRENSWTDLHEIFREGVEWPWDDLITFLVNSEKSRDAAMRNMGMGFVVLSHHSLFLYYLC